MAPLERRPDIETLVQDPGKHFATPRDVIADHSLARGEKRRILESWALDSRLLAVAESENMGGTVRTGLREVKLALLELDERA